MIAETHPVQTNGYRKGRISTKVSLRAYEVYTYIYGAQAALITGDCRGGFSVGELIAFLYAYSFPKQEWHKRVDEALENMELMK